MESGGDYDSLNKVCNISHTPHLLFAVPAYDTKMSEPDQLYAEAVLDCSASEVTFLRYVCQDKCVFCQSQESQRKVLRCLHVACKPCIAEHLSGQNTVTCIRCHKDTPDPGPGRKLVDSLADWPELSSLSGPSPGTESAPICQHSDEDEEPALSKCGECDLYLCECHSTAHGLSKKTKSHVLTLLQSPHSSSPNCQLHPTNELESFCKTCDILLCARCLATSTHEYHIVTSTAEHAEAVSTRLGDRLNNMKQESAIVTEEEEIDLQVNGVMDEAKAISEAMRHHFQSLREALDKREEETRSKLDKRCWEKLKILEGRKEAMVERRAKQLTSQHLLTRCDGASLVQISQAMTIFVEDEKAMTAIPQPIAVVLGGGFAGDLNDEIEVISQLSSLSFTSTGAKLAPFDCTGHSYCNLFDPQRKAPGVSLSSRNQVATACSESECAEVIGDDNNHLWHPIFSVGDYKQGVVHFEIECVRDCCDSFVGVAFPNTRLSSPSLVDTDSGFIGWAGKEYNMGQVTGGKLGQPWQDGDVIRIRMDCDAHKLTAVHVRSGDRDTIEIPSRYTCLSVDLFCDNSIRLRVPSFFI